jgi:inorganic pyrophosphatase
MKSLVNGFMLCVFLSACSNSDRPAITVKNVNNFLSDIEAFASDSLVNVVIEIPAGTNQKWEVNKETGQIEWEQITPDSMRIIDYLAYPANYGFVPQTLLSKDRGGDGDPVDVFVLGPSIAREQVVKVRIVGIIHLLDANEVDSKLLAVDVHNPGFDVNSFEALEKNYPGATDILRIWLLNYKGGGEAEILSVKEEMPALRFLMEAHKAYLNNNE